MIRSTYKTLADSDREVFDRSLNAHVAEGWELVTFTAVSYDVGNSARVGYVALIRRDDLRETLDDRDGRITPLRRLHV